MTFRHVMIDIETLSTNSNATILSIAAVKFNFNNEETQEFSINVNPASCKQYNLHIDPVTVEWWSEQPKDVQESFSKDPVHLTDALTQLNNFIGEYDKNMSFWANGVAFDFAILEWAYKTTKIPCNWRYFQIRDARTVYAVSGLDFKKYARTGSHHNAIDDCLTQIKALKEVLKE
jgi:DNA polymerase elongation subunit (family B)